MSDRSQDLTQLKHNYFLKNQLKKSANLSTTVLVDGISHLATLP
jgi:hypothetical protein